MSVNREELKNLIDSIQEEDAVQVYDFIGYLNMNREKETMEQMNLDHLSEDKRIIYQVQQSRKDRTTGRIYDQKQGLDYLQRKIKELKSEKETIVQMNQDQLYEDKRIIYQVQQSRKDRTTGRIYDQKQGLDYLQRKIKEFESEHDL